MNKPRRFPHMPFYGNDFFGGTVGWTNHEVGMYLRLLWASWESADGTLSGDITKLRRIAAADRKTNNRAFRKNVLKKFKQLPDGRIYNLRLIEERSTARKPVDKSIMMGDRIAPPSSSKFPNDFSRVRTRDLPEPIESPLPPLPETAPSPSPRKRAQAPTAKAKGKPEPPAPSARAHEFPPAPRPVNAQALTPEELAAKEAEAIAYITSRRQQ